MRVGRRLTTRPDPMLETLLDYSRGPDWDVRDYGNGLLPADAPRGASVSTVQAAAHRGEAIPMLIKITMYKVDPDLLARQIARLAEIRDHLLTGTPYPTADDWPDALDGILAMLAERKP